MRSKKLLSFACSLLCAGHCAAFELSTHALMTNRAFERSILTVDANMYSWLGIDVWVRNPQSSRNPFDLILANPDVGTYPEILDNNGNVANRIKNVAGFEIKTIPGEELKKLHATVRGYLMRGAFREDDFPTAKFGFKTLITSPNPQDAPDSNVTRVSNHFFDPRFNRPLRSVLDATIAQSNGFAAVKAVDWATGDVDSFAPVPVAEPNYRNHFSLRRAREAMWRALSYR